MYDEDPGEVLQKAMPDAPPPARFDLDRIVSDGYRARRRHRAALGGTAAAGVAVLAGAMALVVALSPGTGPSRGVEAAHTGIEDIDFDTELAGYPPAFAEDASVGDDAEIAQLEEAARSSFLDLVTEAGLYEGWDPSTEVPSASEILATADERGVSYREALSELGYGDAPLQFTPGQSPGNRGQVFLRDYGTGYSLDETRYAFRIEAVLPGGWTAEPGPVTDRLFPQHLISDGPSYTDEAPEFTSEELGDGRLLLVADHGCAYDVAVVYPNKSALRVSWDVDCGGDHSYPVALDDLTEAALAMPEVDYDVTGLAPVEEPWDVPPGWAYDPEWETEAEDDAVSSVEAAYEVVEDEFEGATLDADESGHASQIGFTAPDASVVRGYGASGSLPLGAAEASYSLGYFLPGGWTEGYADDSALDGTPYAIGYPYLVVCNADWGQACERTEVDGHTVVTKFPASADAEAKYAVTVFDPGGWAVTLTVFPESGAALDADAESALIELAGALPAPVYDEEAQSEIAGD